VPYRDPDAAVPDLRRMLIRANLVHLYTNAAMGDACRDAALELGISFRLAHKDQLMDIASLAAKNIVEAHKKPCPLLTGTIQGGVKTSRPHLTQETVPTGQ
jgi:hypothetical protein